MRAFEPTRRKLCRAALPSVLALLGTMLVTGTASSISLRVQTACAADYYAHCSAYSPTSAEVRSCMRAAGTSLSKRCVDALVEAGEVSAAEVSRRRAAGHTAAK
jgi:hypothetical protein